MIAGLVSLGSLGPAVAWGAEAPDPPSREAIEQVIREYLKGHPEVVEEALQVLEARRRDEEKRQAREAVRANRDQLLNDVGSPVAGNPQGDVTVVEFFDYRCGYCKGVAPDVQKLLAEDPNVRIVYKEFPILGPESDLAARAALAAHAQGKYLPFHDALMTASGPLTLPAILQLSRAAGLDGARLRADMEKPEIRATIERNRALADTLGITGTPAFVIGAELVPGAVGLHGLKALVSQARAR
jgi:protein-disulfide isomerase